MKQHFTHTSKVGETVQVKAAMTPQQKRFTAPSKGALRTYKEYVVGDSGWGSFVGFELYNLLFSNLAGLVGYGSRRAILPRFLKHCGKALTVGRSVAVRQPSKISVGRNVILDDFSVLDVRFAENKAPSEITLGDSVFLGPHSMVLAKGGHISLGDACNISAHCRIASEGNISIGNSVLIAAYVYIGPGNHRFDDPSTPIMEQGMEEVKGISIGDNTWVGARATILDGVRIGKNAIIGAHSLVREDVPDNTIVAGVPAKVIKIR